MVDSINVDFRANPEVVSAVAEGERLTYGHLFNPTYATEVSLIDPLPHQRIAVYQYMLRQSPLRFLLADDAGAGKTIMTGLYLREMLTRRLIRRVLIVPPAGLVSNWEREMNNLFNLRFRIISGSEARNSNPFVDENSNLLIVSIDTLSGDNVFARLREDIEPYDLVVFDESHKLSANRDPDFRVRKTNRYKLAEALAGVQTEDSRWQLDWSCQHLLLLTATPHMGKDYPYYALWKLLEPETLSTPEAFNAYPHSERQRHFLRRTKEEMVFADGSPLYQPRSSDTLSYELTQGEISEQALYDLTTEYIKTVYNRARFLNRSAARLAMSIFQRRLASSTYALLTSLERRIGKLDQYIQAVESGRITVEDLERQQQGLADLTDIFDERTADEEETDDLEENEVFEAEAIGGVVELTLAQLYAERAEVETLVELAQQVYDLGEESKFERLREVVRDPKYRDEKILIFTEHRDTLNFLKQRFEALGYTGQIAEIHGGMPYPQRDEQIDFFRKPASEGGATYLIATDAAGEGLNMQFCRVMVNYDIPWNPARLEQRMGRIHRYGQQYPVVILNLVAARTREGRVLRTLLEKLELIRRELSSDKVFDIIGRILQGMSIKDYMEQVLEREPEDVEREIEASLTSSNVTALDEQEREVYGNRDDVVSHLPQIHAETAREPFFHLLPGYVRCYAEQALPMLDIGFEGDLGGIFSLIADRSGALDTLLPIMDGYPEERRNRFSFYKPDRLARDVVLMHPGEAVFDALSERFYGRFGAAAVRGGVFIDAETKKPYTFHLALMTVVRRADDRFHALRRPDILEERLVGLKQSEDGVLEELPVEHLLLLRGGGYSNTYLRFVTNAEQIVSRAEKYAQEIVGATLIEHYRDGIIAEREERLSFTQQGYDYQEAELANARTKLRKKAREGNSGAQREVERIRQLQRSLGERREQAIAAIEHEADLVTVDSVRFIAHALIIPSEKPEDRKRQTEQIETVAVQTAIDFERTYHGATVQDVSTPAMARAAGLRDNPGFDLLSARPDGTELKIEVKGRARVGDVEISDNEWSAACNLRDGYWLYVVYNCATPQPQLLRIQDPFGKLITGSRGVTVDEREIYQAAEE